MKIRFDYDEGTRRVLRQYSVEADDTGGVYFSEVTQAPCYLSEDLGRVILVPEAPSTQHKWAWDLKVWVCQGQSAVAALVVECHAAIDTLAGQARLRYITSVAGQAETYQRKEQQAREWHASGFEGAAPSFIAAEAEALGVHPLEVANEVIALATYWSEIKGPQIEACRRKWKVAAGQPDVTPEQLAQILADARLEFAAL